MPTKRSGCAVSWPVLIIITIFASLLAAGLFLGIPYLQGRPEFPRGKFQRVVEGNQIMVEMDPDQEVYLIGLPGEVCDLILRAQGKWDEAMAGYLA